MTPIQFSAQIERITSRKDRTLSITVGTQEMIPEESARIFELQGLQVWIALAETALTNEDLDIPEVLSEFDTDKSPSKRLRSVLYVFWKQNEHRLGKTWETFYRGKMEEIIDLIKEKLA